MSRKEVPPAGPVRLLSRLLREGLRVRVGNVLHLAPPLIVTKSDIDKIVAIIDRVITRIEPDQAL
ncbi:MAG: hypothetical protein ACE5JN_15135 [Candidatus Methylomirabilia bacterium]